MNANADVQSEYRFVVCTCNARRDWPSTIDQPFTNRADAEAFAKAISHYLVPKRPGGPPVQWVLVYSLAFDRTAELWSVMCQSYCYLSIDPGEEIVKYVDIPAGYWTC